MSTPKLADSEIKCKIKALLVENLMLQISMDQISDDKPLFGPGGLGLDSVDALQMIIALEKEFGLKTTDAAAAQRMLQSVDTIAAAVQANRRRLF